MKKIIVIALASLMVIPAHAAAVATPVPTPASTPAPVGGAVVNPSVVMGNNLRNLFGWREQNPTAGATPTASPAPASGGLIGALFGRGIQIDFGAASLADHLVRAIDATAGAVENKVESALPGLAEARNVAHEEIRRGGVVIGEGAVNIGEGVARGIALIRNQGFIGAAGLAVIGVGAGITYLVAAKYIKKYLWEPQFVEKHFKGGSAESKKLAPLEECMVISGPMADTLHFTISSTQNALKNGAYHEHTLLHGEPGTGKTLFAIEFAKRAGMDLFIIPAANVSEAAENGKGVENINNLFALAERSVNGAIFFFDEAEVFVRRRELLTSKVQNVQSAFLAKTGTPSKKIKVIIATNNDISDLDKAIKDRFSVKIPFSLPELDARAKQLALHVKKLFEHQQGTIVDYEYADNGDLEPVFSQATKNVNYTYLQDPAHIQALAAQLEGLSGRAIQQFVNRLRQQALLDGSLEITPNLIDTVIARFAVNKK